MSKLIDLMAEMGRRGVWVDGFNEDKSRVRLSSPVNISDDYIVDLLRLYKPEIYSLVWVRDDGSRPGPMFDAV